MENPLQEVMKDEVSKESVDINLQIRTPKKVLHFCDGTIEEFSDDETDSPNNAKADVVDSKSLSWGPWMMHYAWMGGNKALEYCDYWGEGLASILGITTPKYQLEMNEHERMEEEKNRIAEDNAGWTTSNGTNGITPLVVSQPGLGSSENKDPTPV